MKIGLLAAVEAEAGVDGGSPQDVRNLFASAKEGGINVIRFFPFGILDKFTLQTSPGKPELMSTFLLDHLPIHHFNSMNLSEHARMAGMHFWVCQIRLSNKAHAMRYTTGVYNEENWKSLDSIVAQASDAGIKLIMPFADKLVSAQ